MWNYTPRQLAGFQFIAGKRQMREAAKNLSIGTAAARGEPKVVKKQVKKWSEE